MIYRSNLTAPDLQPYFPGVLCHPRHWSMGHDALSEPDLEPHCTFMTHDEAAILHNIALNTHGNWLDIGARTGWTTAHIAAALGPREETYACDLIFADPEILHRRFYGNLSRCESALALGRVITCELEGKILSSAEALVCDEIGALAGVCIDGNHSSPEPLNDACSALARLAENGVIVFHDFWGRPIREGVEFLIESGLNCRIYDTPNGMAVCWRGDFTPPDHQHDPSIDWAKVRKGRAPEFDFARCS